jgi:hypothetical protein
MLNRCTAPSVYRYGGAFLKTPDCLGIFRTKNIVTFLAMIPAKGK